VFYYFPSYGRKYAKPREQETYEKYGKLLMPPREILENENYWYDANHLNQAGAKAYSSWMGKEVAILCTN
jgi:hypothetical protein